MAALLHIQNAAKRLKDKEKEMSEDSYFFKCFVDEYGKAPLKRGDRVRIREGYDGAGEVYFYIGKSTDHTDMVNVGRHDWLNRDLHILAAAIEPYPYSREERIERAIEDYESTLDQIFGESDPLHVDDRALLFAILDAGV